MRKLLALVILLLCASSAHAACSGSGTTWSCPAGATISDINTMISSATTGATATFAAGSYTWNTGTISFSSTKGMTLICATAPPADPSPGQRGGNGAATSGGCDVTVGGSFCCNSNILTANNTNLYRISGFNMTATTISALFNFCGGGSCGTAQINKFRFDHNTLNYPTNQGTNVSVMMLIGDSLSKFNIFGVIDHNVISGTTSLEVIDTIGLLDYSYNVAALGTASNMFIENNTISVTTYTNSGSGCTDGYSDNYSVVFRYNKVTNCRILSHGTNHSGGPDNVEIYRNDVTMDSGATNVQGTDLSDCYRSLHHQGSNTYMGFDNTLTCFHTINSSAIVVQHYRDWPNSNGAIPPLCDGHQVNTSAFGGTFSDGNRTPSTTYYGYPCFRQPGRDVNGRYQPMYFWNNVNTNTGNKVDLVNNEGGGTTPTGFPPSNCTEGAAGSCDYTSFHMLANREWYNAVSVNAQTSSTIPFDGTTGMGFGTLANRPTTCTTSTETAFGNGAAGVGYFATDVGSLGTLYTCSASNTWTVYYTPYTYPHPLVSGSNPQAATPTFSPVGGTYATAQSVTISTTSGGVICYNASGSPATDGASGCTTGTLYSGPVTVSYNQTLYAVAGGTGFTDSAIGSASYTLTNAPARSLFARFHESLERQPAR